MKLLVIADDFTGAVDTGAQFKAKDVLIRVGEEEALLPGTDRQTQVLILDAETRHMGAEEAYRTIYRIVSRAVELGIPCIYKKNGLRPAGKYRKRAERHALCLRSAQAPFYPRLSPAQTHHVGRRPLH